MNTNINRRRPVRWIGRAGMLMAVIASCNVAVAQNFLQVSQPRVYRIDPPISPALTPGQIPQLLSFRIEGLDGAGSLLMGWQSSDGTEGDVVEVGFDFDGLPSGNLLNDAVLVTRVPALAGAVSMDYQRDDRLFLTSRARGTDQAVVGLGGFTFNLQGNIGEVGVIGQFQPLPPGGLGNNLGPEAVAFAGQRDIGGQSIDAGFIVFAGDPAGVWAVDLATADYIDSDPNNNDGANAINPVIAWSGFTGMVNLNPDRHQLRAIDTAGLIAFLLTARRSDPSDAGSIEYFLIQVDFTLQQVLSVVRLNDLFDQRITFPSEALGGGLAVIVLSDGTVRIMMTTAGSGRNLAVLDGQLVGAGSAPIAPGTIPTDGTPDTGGTNDGDGTGTTTQEPVVVYFCPGIGIGFPALMLTTALYLGRSARGARARPVHRG